MENCGVNVSTNTQIWRSLLTKLSKPIMSKVLEKKSSHVLWTPDKMRSTMKKILDNEKNCNDTYKFAHTPLPNQKKRNVVGESSSSPAATFASIESNICSTFVEKSGKVGKVGKNRIF